MERIALAFILVAMLTFSCDRDPYFGPVYENPNDSLQVDSTRNFLLVGCEGNFQLGNASISRVDLLDKTVSNDVFNSANGKLLGDVLQSIYRSGDSLYLILNNSGLIRIVDPISLKQIDVIKGLNSPRYMTIKNGNAYVTSLFSDKVSVINLENLQVESMIQGGDWTEHIIDLEKHFVIAEVNSNKLFREPNQTSIRYFTKDNAKNGWWIACRRQYPNNRWSRNNIPVWQRADAYRHGLSWSSRWCGGSRLHDLFVTLEPNRGPDDGFIPANFQCVNAYDKQLLHFGFSWWKRDVAQRCKGLHLKRWSSVLQPWSK